MYTYVCISKRDSPIKGVSGLGTRAFEVLLIPNTFGSVALLFLQCNLLICHALFLSVCVGGGMEVYVCVRVCVCVCVCVCILSMRGRTGMYPSLWPLAYISHCSRREIGSIVMEIIE